MRSVLFLLSIGDCVAEATTHCDSEDADSTSMLQGKLVHQHAGRRQEPGMVGLESDEMAVMEETLEPDEMAADQPAFITYHTQGWCLPRPTHLLWSYTDHQWHMDSYDGLHSETVLEVSQCAAVCQDHPSCAFFAFAPHEELAHHQLQLKNCVLFDDCGHYPQSDKMSKRFANGEGVCGTHESINGQLMCLDRLFTTYALLKPGQQVPEEYKIPETNQVKYHREIAGHEKDLCLRQYDTGGTCRFFGCHSSRGETQCVNKKCVCWSDPDYFDPNVDDLTCVIEQRRRAPRWDDHLTGYGSCIAQDSMITSKCKILSAGLSEHDWYGEALSHEDHMFWRTSCLSREIPPGLVE